jgi:hypothetical protein
MGNLFDLFHLYNRDCLLNLAFLSYRPPSSPGKAATQDLPYRKSARDRQGDFDSDGLFPPDRC